MKVIVMSEKEFIQELMSAWVDGWYVRLDQIERGRGKPINDDGKREYSKNRCEKKKFIEV